MYLFPGLVSFYSFCRIGLGTLIWMSCIVSDGMLQAAAECLVAYILQRKRFSMGRFFLVFPVVKEAIEEDLGEGSRDMKARELQKLSQEEILTYVQNNMWSPQYPTMVYKKE
ncbi:NAD-dependent malic enzyme 62 kDa isoform, mitochondrial-like isoform X2 [Papaver somniferum]|uniref:NAD-dependent malic enzyme 62 kDa isoform, mitochondrial-like isoform X2 n=1 Tax=Papaver somniferum TaxID=3469 RepID=UPI000E701546|nr:NAD-dependent malic enzyme 62 kDa isoform, mitochondrial-like isoform X2 [Papaver somniferum]